MVEAKDAAEKTPPRRRTWLPMAVWTAAIVAGLGVVWAGASVYATLEGTRRVLGDVFVLDDPATVRAMPKDPRILSPEGAVMRLGGPEEAARKVTFYRQLSWLLPNKVEAPPFAPWGADWESDVSLAVLAECGRAGVPPLVKELGSKRMTARYYAAKGLGRAGKTLPEMAIPALIRALGDSDRSVRLEAASALGDLGPLARDALPALEKFRGQAGWQRDDLISTDEVISKIRRDEKP
jgi:hypothetical protein